MDTAGFNLADRRYGSTRHPFRATLPRHVLRSLPGFEPEVAARRAAAEAEQNETAQLPRRWLGIGTQDVKDFLLAYTACLLALMTFIG